MLLDVDDVVDPERLEAEVGQLEDEARVDDAVGRLQVAVEAQLGVMNESHTLEEKRHFLGNRPIAMGHVVFAHMSSCYL